MSPEHETRAHTEMVTRPDTVPGSGSPAAVAARDPGVGSFAERVQVLLDAHHQDHAGRLRDVADAMAGREAATAAFERVRPLLSASLVRPRVEALAARFPNAALETLDTPGGVQTHVVFGRTDRVPAKATLVTGALLDAERAVASVFTRVEVIPMLVTIPRGAYHDVALDALADVAARGDGASVGARAAWDSATAWLDEQLLAFVRLYLSLETDAGYQQMATHVDPVCGMRVSAGTAAATREYLGRRYYLCSEACDARFAADPGFYVNQRRERAHA